MGDFFYHDAICLSDLGAPSRPSSRRLSYVPLHMKRQKQAPLAMRVMELFFKMFGIWLQTEQLTPRQQSVRSMFMIITVLAMCRVSYQNYRWVVHGTSSSSTEVAAKVLSVTDAVGHFYCAYILWKNQRPLAELLKQARTTRLAKRNGFLMALQCLSVLVVVTHTTLLIHKHVAYPKDFSRMVQVCYVVYAPFKIFWHFAMIMYFVLTMAFADEIQEYLQQMSAKIKTRPLLNVHELCLSAMTFKSAHRSRICALNRAYSLLILILYLKMFLSLLLCLSNMVIFKNQQEYINSIMLSIFFFGQISLLSRAATKVIQRLRVTADTVHKLLVKQSDYLMVAEISRILDFDPERDSLTIWDSFLFCKGTTVTFFAGMVSCLAIILQFDWQIKSKLEKWAKSEDFVLKTGSAMGDVDIKAYVD